MRLALLGGSDRSVRKSIPTTRQLASLQNVQFRKETTWLTNRITVCNAPIANVLQRSEQKQRKREEKSAQRKAERAVEIKSSPDDEKAQ
jgi:hypothetical protein